MSSVGERVWIDVSVPVAPGIVPLWPGSTPLEMTRTLDRERGDEATDTTIRMSVHTGTHIDAPAHTIAGAPTTEQLALDTFVGACFVADLRGRASIDAADLESAGVPAGTTRLLLRTDNGGRWGPDFDPAFVALTPAASQWVVDRGMRLIGVDYLSVQAYGGPRAVHDILLGARVVIVEGLDLRHVEAGDYDVVCLPIALHGCEGAPARVILSPR